MLQDIKDYLVAHGVTTPISISRLPDTEALESSDKIALFQYNGDDPIFVPEYPTVKYERPRLNVLTRSEDPDLAKSYAQTVFLLLSAIVNTSINGHFFQRVKPNGSPFLLQRDEMDRTIYSTNYSVWKEAVSE